MLLEADWVLPISGAPIADGAVLVLDGTIEEVGPRAELQARHSQDVVRTFPGAVLMPGLVNTHTHLDYSAFRGFAPPSEFGEWMGRLLLARRKLDAEDYAVSALWGAHECLRSGVTCIGDTSLQGWSVARAAGSAGLRARVYLEVFCLDDALLPHTLGDLEGRLANLHDECRCMALPPDVGISPHSPYTVSAALYREVGRLASHSQLRVTTHVAESPAEVELLDRGGGTIPEAYRAAGLWKASGHRPPQLSPVAYLQTTGILGPRTLAVHCVQIDGADITALSESGTPVAHCPRSNKLLQCGSAPVMDLLAAGVNVGLGTDSLGSNDSLDIFAEMRAARAASLARISSAETADATVAPLTSDSLLRMATIGGACALGWDDLTGSLEKGKRADLIAVRLPGPVAQPEGEHNGYLSGEDVVESLVAEASASDVEMVMIEGRVVFENLPADRRETRAQRSPREMEAEAARTALDSVRAKLGLEDGRASR